MCAAQCDVDRDAFAFRNEAELSEVAMIASIRRISQRVIQLRCRCATNSNS
jgi:hypothetical protein